MAMLVSVMTGPATRKTIPEKAKPSITAATTRAVHDA
jgi:hypothetical protein